MDVAVYLNESSGVQSDWRFRIDLISKVMDRLRIDDVDLVYLNESPALHDLAERCLHLLAECLIDTGNHVVSDKNLGMPGSYREIFLMLSEHIDILKIYPYNLVRPL